MVRPTSGYRNGTHRSQEAEQNKTINTLPITKQMEQLDFEIRRILQRRDLSEYNKVLEYRNILQQFQVLHQ